MKPSWSLRLDIACFVGQIVAGVFDDDLAALTAGLEALALAAWLEAKQSMPP